MKILLDRNKCTRWQGECESCFANHMVQRNFDAADCGLEAVEDGQDVFQFAIHDRDGSFKKLTVDSQNWGAAYDSWLDVYRTQVAK